MEDSLYDEFGTYIGPELQDSSDEEEEEEEEEERDDEDEEERRFRGGENGYGKEGDESHQQMVVVDEQQAMVLHEDKQYYPEMEEVYPGVNTVILDEDAQGIEEPLIKPMKPKKFSALLSEKGES